MSWSVSKMGSKDKVREAVAKDFDRCAANYAGKEEEQDVLAVKERALAAIDELDTPAGIGVSISASGSRGAWSTTFTLQVQRIELLV